MKRFITLAIAAVFLFSLAACSGSNIWETYRAPQSNEYQFACNVKTYGYENLVPYMSLDKSVDSDGTVSYLIYCVYLFIDDVQGNGLPSIKSASAKHNNKTFVMERNIYTKTVYKNEINSDIAAYRIRLDYPRSETDGILSNFDSDFEITLTYVHNAPDAKEKNFSFVFPMSKCKIEE